MHRPTAACQHGSHERGGGRPGRDGRGSATFDRSAVLLDVREDDEWQRGHAAGAQHIPMGEVPARLNEIDPDAKLYVVCHAGGRSLRVAHYLARNGFVPVNVNGGMLAWVGAGRPVVTGDGGVGTV
jgi:rhodanese-related sulfurtransferase